ncbi:MAG: bifunctional phosphoglucose/phosphomannose isomerase [Anaerolineales bacterium]|nr:bifunctional phosphoglucose/phosphomannose isomerase [Anaerolineales bacterium]
MDLNEYKLFNQIDQENYLSEIDDLPDQLLYAWKSGQEQPLPTWDGIRQVVVAGMGGSAIGADLLAAYLTLICPVPFFVARNYLLPAWAHGQQTLVIASSHSGNTEETLTAFDQALAQNCRILSVCTDGKLAEKSRPAGIPLWTFPHQGQPRAAVGFSFGLLLAAMYRLGLIPNPAQHVTAAVQEMRSLQAQLKAEMPIAQNPAKRLAGQLVGRHVTVFGADILEPVARRWKGQISELAKAWAQFEFLPEADHNTLAGLLQPQEVLSKTIALFLNAASYYPRNQIRTELTRQAFMREGLNTETIQASGETPLAQQWTSLLYGDYTAYYLAMLYNINPTPIQALVGFKQALANT